ncbi:MAG: AMP-binding protein [Thermoplasmatales archaeon]|nr:AMP-binding protein [Thermoplasmatales archaeon]
MNSSERFDIKIKSDKTLKKIDIKNFAELVFKKLKNRDENCDIIWSHDNEHFLKISLKRLRYIVVCIFKELEGKKIKPGDTVILADLLVTNVSFMALMFTTLAAYGCRVLLPMWIETKEIENWIEISNCKAIIYPENEMKNLSKHEREKQILKEIKNNAEKTTIPLYDIENDFNLRKYLYKDIPRNFKPLEDRLVNKILKETDSSYEIAIFTTSGTSGRSKLVVYDQNAYINTISSYEAAGLYKKGKMLGRVFIDIFPHSISVRSLVNALWTGYPICLVNTDWIKNAPNKTYPLIIKMKPEVITLGPSSFGLVMEFIKIIPEIKNQVFSELKTIVSTGSEHSKIISEDWKRQTGLTLHNAYGLIETQQITSTLLNDNFDPAHACLGRIYPGVEIGLKKFNKDTYKLFIKTVFGHKYLIDPIKKKHIYPEDFLDTKDIVRIDKDKNIYFESRENLDFVKNGYGVKVPLGIMKKHYEKLYSQVEHIEYYAPETILFNFGISALIFIKEKGIAQGRVTNGNIIRKYSRIIKKINKELEKNIEPFEFENRAITRFLLINSNVPKTLKNTVSKYIIDVNFKDEIFDLKKSNLEKTGVKNILRPKQRLYFILITILPFNNKKFRKKLLKIISPQKKENIY